ncbi:MAG: ferritin family protein [Lentisphaeria bacterium]|jgi:rubrerythrin
MAEFINPFTGVIPGRKLSHRELVRAIRATLAAEHEAVHMYEAIADATDNPVAKAILQDIANEEKVHAGEFMRVLQILAADEAGFYAEGAAEVDAELAKEGIRPAAAAAADASTPAEPPAIGALKP